MTRYFAADVWLLKDVHRLQQQRLVDAELGDQLADFGGAGELAEDWIEVVQCVTDFVD